MAERPRIRSQDLEAELWLILATALAAGPSRPEVNTRPASPAEFTIGIGGTSLRLVEHRDGTVALMARDSGGSVSCAGTSSASWRTYRNYFANLIAWWPTAPHLRFPPVEGYAAGSGACDVSAYTLNYRLFVEVARIEDGIRTGLVRVEVSPIQTTHSVVDVSVVQRVEDNTFGATLLESAQAIAAGFGGAPYDPERAASRLTAAVEDTQSYNVQVIDAHSDLSLFVLVLDAYLLGGALPNNSDIEAAYRLRKVLRLTDSESFFAILAHLARDEAATAILQRIQSCEEGVGVPQCLREFAPPP